MIIKNQNEMQCFFKLCVYMEMVHLEIERCFFPSHSEILFDKELNDLIKSQLDSTNRFYSSSITI